MQHIDDISELSLALPLNGKITVIFVLTFAELASTPSVKENSRNLGRVIEDLELIKLVSNVFSVVIHLVILKESLVFGIQDCLFVVIWVIAVKRT